MGMLTADEGPRSSNGDVERQGDVGKANEKGGAALSALILGQPPEHHRGSHDLDQGIDTKAQESDGARR